MTRCIGQTVVVMVVLLSSASLVGAEEPKPTPEEVRQMQQFRQHLPQMMDDIAQGSAARKEEAGRRTGQILWNLPWLLVWTDANLSPQMTTDQKAAEHCAAFAQAVQTIAQTHTEVSGLRSGMGIDPAFEQHMLGYFEAVASAANAQASYCRTGDETAHQTYEHELDVASQHLGYLER